MDGSPVWWTRNIYMEKRGAVSHRKWRHQQHCHHSNLNWKLICSRYHFPASESYYSDCKVAAVLMRYPLKSLCYKLCYLAFYGAFWWQTNWNNQFTCWSSNIGRCTICALLCGPWHTLTLNASSWTACDNFTSCTYDVLYFGGRLGLGQLGVALRHRLRG